MTADDIDEFFVLLDEVYDLMGKTPAAKVISASGKSLFFKALMQFSLADVKAALDAHVQEGTFTPVPNDIKAQIERRQPVLWVSGDEAWGQVPKLESDAGLLNQVTAGALAQAQPLIDDGDMIAARRTFIDAYDRLVAVARVHADPAQRVPVTFVSGGNLPLRHQDAHGERQMLLERAQSTGLLPAPRPTEAPQLAPPTAGGRARLKAELAKLQMKSLPPPPGAEE